MLFANWTFSHLNKKKIKKYIQAFTITQAMLVIAVGAFFTVIFLSNILYWQNCKNAAKAKAILKSLAYTLETYKLSSKLSTYPEDLRCLIKTENTLFSDKQIESGTLSFKESGYWFIYLPQQMHLSRGIESYDIFAMPIIENSTNAKNFVMNEGGTVYLDSGKHVGVVDEHDEPIF